MHPADVGSVWTVYRSLYASSASDHSVPRDHQTDCSMGPQNGRKRKAEEPEEEVEEAEEESESSEDEGEESDEAETDYSKFMEQIKEKEEQLGKYCMVLGHIEQESDEDEDEDEEEKEPSMEQLQALARVSSNCQITLPAGAAILQFWCKALRRRVST